MQFVRITLPCIFLCVSICSAAQSPADYWYFGYKAGVHFTSTGPQSILDGQLHTVEGVATISDESGQLLFYSDGDSVWNRIHQVMPNGTGLLGDGSSSQSAVICPDPASSDRFYLFTVDDAAGPDGFRYSIVDMGLDGGLGDIDTGFKNILIKTPVCEKISAVANCDKSGYWIIIRDVASNEVLSYSLTSSGLDTGNPVISYGLLDTLYFGGGYLKASHDGKYVAMCHSAFILEQIELFKFNSQTGVLTDPIKWLVQSPDSITSAHPYGLEFSPDNSKLYISGFRFIHQYSLDTYDSAAIHNSEYLVAKDDSLEIPALQLGVDGKIYSNTSFHLSVIHDPNEQNSACNFELKDLYLNGRFGSLGLPNFIQSEFYNPIQTQEICIDDSVTFHFEDSCANSFIWTFDDPGSGTADTSTLSHPTHHFSDTGTYEVQLVVEYPTVNDTFTNTIYVVLPPSPLVLKDSLFLCRGGSAIADAHQFRGSYVWSTGSDSGAIVVDQPGWYVVTISNVCSTIVDSIIAMEVDSLSLDLGADTALCAGSELVLNARVNGLGTSYLWWKGDTNVGSQLVDSAMTANLEADTIWLQVANACNTVSDTIIIQNIPLPEAELPPDTVVCDQQPITVIRPETEGVEYLWNDSTDGSSRQVSSSQIIWLLASNECGTNTDTMRIAFAPEIKVELGPDTTICSGDSIILGASWPGASYLWSQGNTSDSTLIVSADGFYQVTITVPPCQKVTGRLVEVADEACDSLDCRFSIPNVITPNGDGLNDRWTVKNDCQSLHYSVRIFNRWGQLIYTQAAGAGRAFFSWDGFVNGSQVSEGAYFYIIEYENLQGESNTQHGSFTVLN